MCVLKVEHVCAERQHVQWRRKLKIFGGQVKKVKIILFWTATLLIWSKLRMSEESNPPLTCEQIL